MQVQTFWDTNTNEYKAANYPASTLAANFGLTVAEARQLKLGEIIDVADEVAESLISAQIAVEVK